MKTKRNVMISIEELQKMSDADLSLLSFSLPWQFDAVDQNTDPDGFDSDKVSADPKKNLTRDKLQSMCWDKFNYNPNVNTAVRGQIGRLAGFGFEMASDIAKIHDVIIETEYDQRNRLFTFWPKFIGRAFIEGELLLCLTVHLDGFVEVDFLDPSLIKGGGDDGVLYHPMKKTMPLFYFVEDGDKAIPSIYVAYYPDLLSSLKDGDITTKAKNWAKDTNKKYKSLGGYNRFIVSWDRSMITKRNVSYLRTVLEWLNHYENLKKYEIDHKKSAGAYLWVVTIEDAKSFRSWLSLTDEERRKTGIMAKKTPGGTLVLPPGMKLEVRNPTLPKISEGDTDIFHMITGGLNEPEDVSSGQSKGTFASVKASRGPMSDRISDEVAYFERFLKFDFYAAIFHLKHKIAGFPDTFTIKECVDFDEDKEPIMKNVKKKPQFLVEVSFPTSEVIDAESRAKAYLGVKHASLFDTVGIPNAEISRRLGFGSYKRQRLAHATEKEKYPELIPTLDAESYQESQLEPGKGKQPAKPVGKQPVGKQPYKPIKKKNPPTTKNSEDEEEE